MVGQLALFEGVQLVMWTPAQLVVVPSACPRVPGVVGSHGEQRPRSVRISLSV